MAIWPGAGRGQHRLLLVYTASGGGHHGVHDHVEHVFKFIFLKK